MKIRRGRERKLKGTRGEDIRVVVDNNNNNNKVHKFKYVLIMNKKKKKGGFKYLHRFCKDIRQIIFYHFVIL